MQRELQQRVYLCAIAFPAVIVAPSHLLTIPGEILTANAMMMSVSAAAHPSEQPFADVDRDPVCHVCHLMTNRPQSDTPEPPEIIPCRAFVRMDCGAGRDTRFKPCASMKLVLEDFEYRDGTLTSRIAFPGNLTQGYDEPVFLFGFLLPDLFDGLMLFVLSQPHLTVAGFDLHTVKLDQLSGTTDLTDAGSEMCRFVPHRLSELMSQDEGGLIFRVDLADHGESRLALDLVAEDDDRKEVSLQRFFMRSKQRARCDGKILAAIMAAVSVGSVATSARIDSDRPAIWAIWLAVIVGPAQLHELRFRLGLGHIRDLTDGDRSRCPAPKEVLCHTCSFWFLTWMLGVSRKLVNPTPNVYVRNPAGLVRVRDSACWMELRPVRVYLFESAAAARREYETGSAKDP